MLAKNTSLFLKRVGPLLLCGQKAGVSGFAVRYEQYGDPHKVLRGHTYSLPPIKKDEVLVRMLASPVNPADINMIQGAYPIKPPLPAIGGNEGLAEVLEVGSDVSRLEAGEWVIPAVAGWGTWRTHAVCTPYDLIKIPRDISPIAAATLAVNPCTAYRMIHDFVPLKDGDVIIQNGANSGCGQAIIQIADQLNIQTINIIRDRPKLHELVETLKNLGATHVFTEDALRKAEVKELLRSMEKPKLALNCVGGRSSAELLKFLDPKGTMVTYGGMSRQPLMVPAGPLIFQDVRLKGFWMTRWNNDHRNSPQRQHMIKYLCNMIKHRNLKGPICRLLPMSEFEEAISASSKPFSTEKQILVTDNSLLADSNVAMYS